MLTFRLRHVCGASQEYDKIHVEYVNIWLRCSAHTATWALLTSALIHCDLRAAWFGKLTRYSLVTKKSVKCRGLGPGTMGWDRKLDLA